MREREYRRPHYELSVELWLKQQRSPGDKAVRPRRDAISETSAQHEQRLRVAEMSALIWAPHRKKWAGK